MDMGGEDAGLGSTLGMSSTGDALSNQEDKLREMQAALDARLKMDGEMRKVEKMMEDIERNRAKQMAQSKRTLGEQLESLDKQAIEVVERWHNESDFSKIDLVCAELVKKGSYSDTLKYMEKVQVLIANVCTKLARKAFELEGVTHERYKVHLGGTADHNKPIPMSVTKAAVPVGGGSASLGKAKSAAVKQDLPKANPTPVTKTTVAKSKYLLEEPHHPEDLAQIRTLTGHKKDLSDQLDKRAEEIKAEKLKRAEVDKNLKSAQNRLLARGLEIQSLTAKVKNLEKALTVMDESNKGLTGLLRKKDEEMRTRLGKASRLHQKLMVDQLGEDNAKRSTTASRGGQTPAPGEETLEGAEGRETPEPEPEPMTPEQLEESLAEKSEALRGKEKECSRMARELKELREHTRKRAEEAKAKDETIQKLREQLAAPQGEASWKSKPGSPSPYAKVQPRRKPGT